jgi:hypothetical protein
MLHWAMRSVLLQCVRVVIKTAHDGGTFARRQRLFCLALL